MLSLLLHNLTVFTIFGDSVHPSQQTRPAYGSVKKGKDRLLEVKSGRKPINLIGALSLEDMDFVYKDYGELSTILRNLG